MILFIKIINLTSKRLKKVLNFKDVQNKFPNKKQTKGKWSSQNCSKKVFNHINPQELLPVALVKILCNKTPILIQFQLNKLNSCKFFVNKMNSTKWFTGQVYKKWRDCKIVLREKKKVTKKQKNNLKKSWKIWRIRCRDQIKRYHSVICIIMIQNNF